MGMLLILIWNLLHKMVEAIEHIFNTKENKNTLFLRKTVRLEIIFSNLFFTSMITSFLQTIYQEYHYREFLLAHADARYLW